MKKNYILAFSSFYKSAYAQEKLAEKGIRSKVKKLPPEIMGTCGYALYLVSPSIQTVIDILNEKEISSQGVYLIEDEGGRILYRKIA